MKNRAWLFLTPALVLVSFSAFIPVSGDATEKLVASARLDNQALKEEYGIGVVGKPAIQFGNKFLMLLLQALRTALWACYRPHPLWPGELPSLTVVVPVYNEGAMVARCLKSVAGADYPRDRLEIVCVRRLHRRLLDLPGGGQRPPPPLGPDHPLSPQPGQEGGPLRWLSGGPGRGPGDRGFGQRH